MGKFTIQKKKLYEEVIDQISRLIKSREYKVDDRLPSLQELSEMFDVGKPTLREALSVLGAAGILEIKHGSGIFVRKLVDDQLYDVSAQLGKVETEELLHWLEYRRAIEVEAAGLAAKRRNELDIKSIEEAQLHLVQGTYESTVHANWDYEFHKRIAVATHNPVFVKAINITTDIFQEFFELSHKQLRAVPSRGEVSTMEHKEILDCIKRGQALEARKAMLHHLNNVEKKVELLSEAEAPQGTE